MSRLAQLEKLHAADAADADVMYMIAQEHAKAGDFDSAIAWYDRCLAADPKYVYAFYHKARAQQATGDVPAAVQSARAGLARARELGQAKAQSELASLLDELEP
ncbi:MAG: tetratricopeptide repeat protein [Phycisphaerae bacterium]|nr:tetratricopeptide repeat protein [Phycisphaerae bacterium]